MPKWLNSWSIWLHELFTLVDNVGIEAKFVDRTCQAEIITSRTNIAIKRLFHWNKYHGAVLYRDNHVHKLCARKSCIEKYTSQFIRIERIILLLFFVSEITADRPSLKFGKLKWKEEDASTILKHCSRKGSPKAKRKRSGLQTDSHSLEVYFINGSQFTQLMLYFH